MSDWKTKSNQYLQQVQERNNRQKRRVAVIHWHFFDSIRLSIFFRKILDEGHFKKRTIKANNGRFYKGIQQIVKRYSKSIKQCSKSIKWYSKSIKQYSKSIKRYSKSIKRYSKSIKWYSKSINQYSKSIKANKGYFR